MKKRVRWLAATLAALVAGILLPSPVAMAAGAGWYTSYEEALAAAKREGKPIFADFSTTWCGMCRQLEQQTFPDPSVSSRLDNFVKLHIDAEQRADVAQRYGVQAYPTMVMLDPSGQVVNKEVGFVKPRQLAGSLDKTMQMVGPALAQAQQQARMNAEIAAEVEAQKREVDQAAADTKVAAKAEKVATKAESSRIGKSVPVLTAPPEEPKQLATLDAPKLTARDTRVNSLLRGKNLGGASEGDRQERLIAQAATEEVEELPRPLLGTAAARDTEPEPKAEKTPQKPKATPAPVPKATETPAPEKAAEADETPTPAEKKSAASSTSTGTKKDPLATIRKLQNSGKSDTGATKSPAGADDNPKEVTADDVTRWIKDADSKLIAQRKREARAMYGHVVEKDPDNKHGKTDMAFIKMVSLMVDQDDDALRLKAYNKIKEFEARFPESPHKDYYTLIRATLAADLGETNSAHKLLENYTERFPDSKYQKLAYDTWKSLPPVKKESASASSGPSSKSSGGSSKTSSGSSKSSSGSSKKSSSN